MWFIQQVHSPTLAAQWIGYVWIVCEHTSYKMYIATWICVCTINDFVYTFWYLAYKQQQQTTRMRCETRTASDKKKKKAKLLIASRIKRFISFSARFLFRTWKKIIKYIFRVCCFFFARLQQPRHLTTATFFSVFPQIYAIHNVCEHIIHNLSENIYFRCFVILFWFVKDRKGWDKCRQIHKSGIKSSRLLKWRDIPR